MYSKRQNKISRLIQKELAGIFLKEGLNISGGAMITVTIVRMSPDLGVAKVYLSIFTSGKKQEILEKIQHNARHIRSLLAQEIRHQLKRTPELIFYEDDSLDYIENIDNLLKS